MLESESEPEPESEPSREEEPEDERDCKEKVRANLIETRDNLAMMPVHWKIIWVVVLLLWAPIAYTVAAPVPGSMYLFLVAWTAFVLRCAGSEPPEEEQQPRESELGVEGATQTAANPLGERRDTPSSPVRRTHVQKRASCASADRRPVARAGPPSGSPQSSDLSAELI